MENFETWLRSHNLTALYLMALKEPEIGVESLLMRYGDVYILHFTREMLKIYEGTVEVVDDCVQVVDELLEENMRLREQNKIFRGMVKDLLVLIEE